MSVTNLKDTLLTKRNAIQLELHEFKEYLEEIMKNNGSCANELPRRLPKVNLLYNRFDDIQSNIEKLEKDEEADHWKTREEFLKGYREILDLAAEVISTYNPKAEEPVIDTAGNRKDDLGKSSETFFFSPNNVISNS